MTECAVCRDDITPDDKIIPLTSLDGSEVLDSSIDAQSSEEVIFYIHQECLGITPKSEIEEQEDDDDEEESDDKKREYICAFCDDPDRMTKKGVKIHQSRVHSEKVDSSASNYRVIKVTNPEDTDHQDGESSDGSSVDGHEKDKEPDTEYEPMDSEDLSELEKAVRKSDGIPQNIIKQFFKVNNEDGGCKSEVVAKGLVEFFNHRGRGVYYVKSKQVSAKIGEALSPKQLAIGFTQICENPQQYSISVEEYSYTNGTTWKVEV